jgi:hypothetical protein
MCTVDCGMDAVDHHRVPGAPLSGIVTVLMQYCTQFTATL